MTYDLALFERDRVQLGWNYSEIARRAAPRLSPSRVTRFFGGAYQTPNTAKVIAEALGHDIARYVRVPRAAATPRRNPNAKTRATDVVVSADVDREADQHPTFDFSSEGDVCQR